jgi:transposase
MHPISISDEQWARIAPVIPDTRGGRPRKRDARLILDGILYTLANGKVADVPSHLPPWQTIYWHKRQWLKAGVLARIDREIDHPLLKKLLKKTDLRSTRMRSRSRIHHPHEDFYPTPACAILPFLAEEKFDGLVWEPACGQGHMSKLLIAAGYDVLSTDLIDRGYGIGNHDFHSSPFTATHVVTNPPYKEAQKFVETALAKTSMKVAVFVQTSFLTGVKRGKWLRTAPLARVYRFSRRITLWVDGKEPDKKNGSGCIDYIWCVFVPGHTGPYNGYLLD